MTNQVKDSLVYEGVRGLLFDLPDLPDDVLLVRNPDWPPTEFEMGNFDTLLASSACWRGYQAKWEITNSKLWLTEVRGKWNLKSTEPLLADWFSGELRVLMHATPKKSLVATVIAGVVALTKEQHCEID